MELKSQSFKTPGGFKWKNEMYGSLLKCLSSKGLVTLKQLNELSKNDYKDLTAKITPGKEIYRQYRDALENFIVSYADSIVVDLKGVIREKLMEAANQFHLRDDINEQTDLMKKLVILYLANKENNINIFMTNGQRMSLQAKQNLLGIIYDKNIKDSHYAMLNLLVPYRYIIKQKVKEFKILCRDNGIVIEKEFLHAASFVDIEDTFYEVLERINKKKNFIETIESPTQSTLYETVLSKKIRELCMVDDIANFITVDLYLLDQAITHKMNSKLLETISNDLDFKNSVLKEIENFRKSEQTEKTTVNNLTLLVNKTLRLTSPPLFKLKRQILCYLKLLQKGSGLTVQSCNSYPRDRYQGAKVCATQSWSKHSILHILNGYSTRLKEGELQYLIEHKLNFSVTTSAYKKENLLWLGPGSYVNHSCRPNAKIFCNKAGGEICLQAITEINKGEEITWNYGPEYFEVGDCKCSYCTNKVCAL